MNDKKNKDELRLVPIYNYGRDLTPVETRILRSEMERHVRILGATYQVAVEVATVRSNPPEIMASASAIIKLADAIPLRTPEEQDILFALILPDDGAQAILLAAELKARLGYYPLVIRVQREPLQEEGKTLRMEFLVLEKHLEDIEKRTYADPNRDKAGDPGRDATPAAIGE